MKMFLKRIMFAVMVSCIGTGVAVAQNNMEIDIRNTVLSSDGLTETFDLYASALSGYASAGGWTSINYRADVNAGSNNISAVSFVSNNAYTDGAAGQFGSHIPGGSPSGSSAFGVAINREISGGGADLVIGAPSVLFGSVTITFINAVVGTDVITPRSASSDPASTNQSFYANGDEIRHSIAGSPQILPIILSSFTGVKINGGNQLNWVAASPSNFSHFELQRRTSGNSFATISKVDVSSTGNYKYLDADVKGTNFYRLALIDLDGKITYSATVAIIGDAATFTIASLYPNPVINALNVVSYSPTSINVTYTVTDMSGKLLKQEMHAANLTTTQTLDVSALSNGTYLLNINANGTVINKKFTKL